jgi:transcriptional regulator with XRE-family HTH domain
MDMHNNLLTHTQAQALQQLREERGLSREDLASRARVSLYTIRNVELRRHRPHRATVAMLAHALGVAPEDLGM